MKDERFEKHTIAIEPSYDDFDVTNAAEMECPKSEYQ